MPQVHCVCDRAAHARRTPVDGGKALLGVLQAQPDLEAAVRGVEALQVPAEEMVLFVFNSHRGAEAARL